MDLAALRAEALEITSRGLEWKDGFACLSPLHASSRTSDRGPAYPSASPLDQLFAEVQEC